MGTHQNPQKSGWDPTRPQETSPDPTRSHQIHLGTSGGPSLICLLLGSSQNPEEMFLKGPLRCSSKTPSHHNHPMIPSFHEWIPSFHGFMSRRSYQVPRTSSGMVQKVPPGPQGIISSLENIRKRRWDEDGSGGIRRRWDGGGDHGHGGPQKHPKMRPPRSSRAPPSVVPPRFL